MLSVLSLASFRFFPFYYRVLGICDEVLSLPSALLFDVDERVTYESGTL